MKHAKRLEIRLWTDPTKESGWWAECDIFPGSITSDSISPQAALAELCDVIAGEFGIEKVKQP